MPTALSETISQAEQWLTENYTLLDKGGKTELQIDTEIDSSYKALFEKMWPEALQVLKTCVSSIRKPLRYRYYQELTHF